MARGRFLSKTVSTSEQLASDTLSLRAALLFTWCIPHLDVDGRCKGSPAWIKAEVVPLRDEYTIAGVAQCLAEMRTAGLVQWYAVNGLRILQFGGFMNHNSVRRDREAPSLFAAADTDGATQVPAPTGSPPATINLESSSDMPGALPADAGFSPTREVKVSEVKVSKGSVASRPATPGVNHKPNGADLTNSEVMGVVRAYLYWPDDKPPAGYHIGRDVTVIKALRKQGYSGYQMAEAIQELRLMCEQGELGRKHPGEKLTMRAMYNTGHGVRPLLPQLLERVYTRPVSRAPTAAPEQVGSLVEGVMRSLGAPPA